MFDACYGFHVTSVTLATVLIALFIVFDWFSLLTENVGRLALASFMANVLALPAWREVIAASTPATILGLAWRQAA